MTNPRGTISGRTLQAWAFHCGVLLLACAITLIVIVALRPGG